MQIVLWQKAKMSTSLLPEFIEMLYENRGMEPKFTGI